MRFGWGWYSWRAASLGGMRWRSCNRRRSSGGTGRGSGCSGGGGRPRAMAQGNPTWAEERIAAALLLKLGSQVSLRSVRCYMPRGTRTGNPTSARTLHQFREVLAEARPFRVVLIGRHHEGTLGGDFLGTNTSTRSVNLRISPGPSAPTPTTRRSRISPLPSWISMSTEYSQTASVPGCRIVPSTVRGQTVPPADVAAVTASNRRCRWHAGQVTALRRIRSAQCGQFHDSPVTPWMFTVWARARTRKEANPRSRPPSTRTQPSPASSTLLPPLSSLPSDRRSECPIP